MKDLVWLAVAPGLADSRVSLLFPFVALSFIKSSIDEI